MSRDNVMETTLGRLCQSQAENIDDIVAPFDRRFRPEGRPVFPASCLPTPKEAPFRAPDAVFIGVRVDAPRDDLANLALELASLSLEHGAGIVVLSGLDYSGLERFGFRSDRITGDTPEARAACEEQLRRFWGLELIL